MVTGLLSSNISQAAKKAVVSRAISWLATHWAGSPTQSETVLAEKRVS